LEGISFTAGFALAWAEVPQPARDAPKCAARFPSDQAPTDVRGQTGRGEDRGWIEDVKGRSVTDSERVRHEYDDGVIAGAVERLRPKVMTVGAIIGGAAADRAPQIRASKGAPFCLRSGKPLWGVPQVMQHDEARLRGETCERDESEGDGKLILKPRQQGSQMPPASAKGNVSITIAVSVRRREIHE
jgi:hypothetical protein